MTALTSPTSPADQPDQPWSRGPNEPEHQYEVFRSWLPLCPRPPIPAEWLETAGRYDWAGRAVAYDQSVTVLAALGGGAMTIDAALEDIFGSWLTVSVVEGRKLKRQSLTDPNPRMSWADFTRLGQQLVELAAQRAARGAGAALPDMSRLTDDERATFVALLLKLEG